MLSGRAEKGEELNMSSGEHGIPMTSSRQVLFAVVIWSRGALRLFDCHLRPVGPVLEPQPQVWAESGKAVCLRLKHHELKM